MQTGTRITIDLADELTANELASFRAKAKEAGAKTLTDHFKRIVFGEEKPEVAAQEGEATK